MGTPFSAPTNVDLPAFLNGQPGLLAALFSLPQQSSQQGPEAQQAQALANLLGLAAAPVQQQQQHSVANTSLRYRVDSLGEGDEPLFAQQEALIGARGAVRNEAFHCATDAFGRTGKGLPSRPGRYWEQQPLSSVELDIAALLQGLAGKLNSLRTQQRRSSDSRGGDARTGADLGVNQATQPSRQPLRGGGQYSAGPGTAAEEETDSEYDHDNDTDTHDTTGSGGVRKRMAHGTLEVEEQRRLKRMAKNRATAAASRERKRQQLEQLSARVSLLENSNIELQKELLLKHLEGEVFREILRKFSLTERTSHPKS